MKYLLLDVSGTILYKPTLFDRIQGVLSDFEFSIDKSTIQYNHKILSETIKFPDRTDIEFYSYFNSELLYSLGVIPTSEIVSALFKACSYLPWEKYEDTKVLHEISIPMGILSNFNATLEGKLNQFFGTIFKDIFVSETIGKSKPSIEFHQYALEKINIDPKDILYIGDSFKLDFEPAVSLGISTFVIDRDGFYKNNVNVISSLSEIKNIINK
ncbi:HAD family hydrolase [Flavobacterium ovatum]|uniref:HAD family hydrolase n=1 Tax=Flavobacterium ovatum TaxID=1928857 RepID=UPI00344CD16A